MCRSWAFCLFLAVLWEGNAVSPAAGFSYWTWGGPSRRGGLVDTPGPECCPARASAKCLQPLLHQATMRLRGARRGVELRCVDGPEDSNGRSQTPWPVSYRAASSKGTIPEVSRQTYQDAALGGLIAVGQDVPDDWLPGDQFAFTPEGFVRADTDGSGDLSLEEWESAFGGQIDSAALKSLFEEMDSNKDGRVSWQEFKDGLDSMPTSKFKEREVVVVLMSDGNLKFGKIRNQNPSGTYSVAIAENRLGTKHLELAPAKIGKVLPLSQREIQRLGSSNLPSKGSKSTVIKNTGFFSSIRDMVDVDKRSAREETLPFQPMLSRRSAPLPSTSAAISPKPEGRVGSVMSGADSGEWGELDGWWRNEQEQTDVFEVLLQRPLGMDLDEVGGEGIFVKSLEEGGYAQQAGVRVGDRVMVPGPGKDGWRGDLVSVLSAISQSTGNRLRLRYMRSVAASTAASALAVGDAKQRQRGERQSWRGRSSSDDGYGELDMVVKKPIGMRLTEVEGQGIFVSEVATDGNAAAAGIRVGDRVTKTSAPPGFESGIEFDRGTTYFTAVYSKRGPTALQRFISEVKVRKKTWPVVDVCGVLSFLLVLACVCGPV